MTKKLNLSKEIESTILTDFNHQQDNLKVSFKEFKVHQWICFVGFILSAISVLAIIISFGVKAYLHKDLWTVVDKFTNLSNVAVFAYCTIYLFHPNKHYFKQDYFLIAVLTYIGFTFFGYNIILAWIGKYEEAYRGTYFHIFTDVWKHIVIPIYFTLFGIYSMYERPWSIPTKKWKVLLICMIFPTFYIAYLASAPFWIQTPVLVLNPETGMKEILIIDNKIVYEPYSVYDWPTNTKEYPIAWVFVSVAYFVLIPIFIFLYYILWYILWKKTYIKKLIKKEKENEQK